MEQEFESDNPLVKKVGVFINPTPTANKFNVVVSYDDGTGQFNPYGSLTFKGSAAELRTFAESILETIAPSSELLGKKVVDNKNYSGRIVGINKTNGLVDVYWPDTEHSTWESLDDLVVLD